MKLLLKMNNIYVKTMNTISDTFKEYGYVVLPNLFNSNEIKQLTDDIYNLYSSNDEKSIKWNMKDGVSRCDLFWWLLSHDTLINKVKEVLCCSNISYLETSSIKVWHKQNASGWHRDSVDVEFGRGDDWHNSIYKIVRVAIYLQPEEHDFQWGAIPHSHLRENILTKNEQEIWRRRLPSLAVKIGSRLPYLPIFEGRVWISTSKQSFYPNLPTEPVWIRPVRGDVILFDPRLIHAGGDVPMSKYALLMSYGARNKLSQKHMLHYSPAWSNDRHECKYKAYINYLKNKRLL